MDAVNGREDEGAEQRCRAAGWEQGVEKERLETPALCLDLDRLEANIKAVAAACRRQNVAWRPHAKGHKSSHFCSRQLQAGAVGATCAKVSEAQVLAQHGVKDLLVANLLAGPAKVARLVALRKAADPIACVDHVDQVGPIAEAMRQAGLSVRMILEIDVGLHRVGVGALDDAVKLARLIDRTDGVQLVGIMGYEGHLLTLENPVEKREKIFHDLAKLVEVRDRLIDDGLPCPIVSAGGTGSYQITIEAPGVTEVQAGGAVYMDAFYRDKCGVADLQFALTVLATVVSRPTRERAIIDAGRKTMNIEIHTPQTLDRPDIRVVRLSAEHGQLELSPSAFDLRIGDRLEFIPGYGDLTTCLHDRFYCFREGRLVDVWPVEARGALV